MQTYKYVPIVYMHVRCIVLFAKRCIISKVMIICSFLNNYFDIAGETWEIPKTTFNEFRLIVNLFGTFDSMRTDSCILRSSLDIFTHNNQTYFIC